MSTVWGMWTDQWSSNSKVDFDGLNKLIIVHPDVTTLNIRTDVYSAWVDWLGFTGVYNTKWLQALKYSGMDAIPGGESGGIFFTINGWKLIIDFNKVAVSGVLFSEDFNTAYWSPEGLPLFPAVVSSLVNSAVTTQNVVTGTVVTPAEIWEYVDRQLTVATGMTPSQEAKIDAIPTNPLLSTDVRLDNIDIKTSDIWNAPVNPNLLVAGSMGEWVMKKLLSVPKFLGLK